MPEEFIPSVVCVICLHEEGSLCIPTLKSLITSLEYARRQNKRFRYELLAILDRIDSITESIFIDQLKKLQDHFNGVVYTYVDFGCPAKSRNHAIESSSGDIILILDGDDLVDEKWLYKSALQLSSTSKPYILHPEFNFIFGKTPQFMHHPSMENNISVQNIVIENFWTALCAAHRQTFINFPYQSNASSQIFGYEDWKWNIDTIFGGCIHHTLAGTWHFIRRKEFGVSFTENTQLRVLRRSDLFIQREFLYEQGKDTAIQDSGGFSQIDEESYLVMHPDVRDGVRLDFFPSANYHYKKYGIGEKRLALPASFSTSYAPLRGIDSALDSNVGNIGSLQYYSPVKNNEYTKSYLSCLRMLRTALLCRITTNPISHIIIAPWLKKGGADLACLYHLRALSQKKVSTLLILTEDSPSEWSDKIPNGIFLLNIGKYLSGMDSNQSVKLLFLLIQLVSPRNIHCINSAAGWDCINRFGSELRVMSNIYASLYCNDYDREGNPTGYCQNLQVCSSFISKIFSDNRLFAEFMVETYGVASSRISVLKHPVLEGRAITDAYSGSVKTVLWASRFDRQKNPRLLFEIAQSLPDYNFIVYGEPMLDSDNDMKALFNDLGTLSNITMKGSFSCFSEIASSGKYSIFLYTSLWDGLPNIVLEAACSGLPVVASHVGGIPELLNHERGLAIKELTDPNPYIKGIRLYLDNSAIADQHRLALKTHIKNNFNWESYLESLDASGYFGEQATSIKTDLPAGSNPFKNQLVRQPIYK